MGLLLQGDQGLRRGLPVRVAPVGEGTKGNDMSWTGPWSLFSQVPLRRLPKQRRHLSFSLPRRGWGSTGIYWSVSVGGGCDRVRGLYKSLVWFWDRLGFLRPISLSFVETGLIGIFQRPYSGSQRHQMKDCMKTRLWCTFLKRRLMFRLVIFTGRLSFCGVL